MPTQTQAIWKNDTKVGSDASVAAISLARVWRGYVLCIYKDNKKDSNDIWANIFDPYTHQKWLGSQEIGIPPKAKATSVMPPAVAYLNLNVYVIVSQSSGLGYYTIPYPADADTSDDFKKALVTGNLNPIAISDCDIKARPAVVNFLDKLFLLYRNTVGIIKLCIGALGSGSLLIWQNPLDTNITGVTGGPALTLLNGGLYCAHTIKGQVIVRKSTDGLNWGPASTVPGANTNVGPSISADPTGSKLIVLWAASDETLHTIESTDGVTWTNAQPFPGKTQDSPALMGSAAGVMLAVYRASTGDDLYYSHTDPDVFNVLPLAPPPAATTQQSSSPGPSPAPASTLPNKLTADQKLMPGGKIGSPDGHYIFTLQTDGNICLYEDGNNTWASATNSADVAYLVMQPEGNLVLCNKQNKTVWQTKTDKHKGAYLAVDNDGNAVIRGSDEKVLWATKTGSTS